MKKLFILLFTFICLSIYSQNKFIEINTGPTLQNGGGFGTQFGYNFTDHIGMSTGLQLYSNLDLEYAGHTHILYYMPITCKYYYPFEKLSLNLDGTLGFSFNKISSEYLSISPNVSYNLKHAYLKLGYNFMYLVRKLEYGTINQYDKEGNIINSFPYHIPETKIFTNQLYISFGIKF